MSAAHVKAAALGQTTLAGFLSVLARRARLNDPVKPAIGVFLAVLALMGLGLLVQASAAATTNTPEVFSRELVSQVLFRLAGVFVLLAGWRLGPQGLRPWLAHFALVSALFLLLVYTPFGVVRNGAHRWLDLGFVAFQPSELARIALVLWIADRCVRLGPLVIHLRRGVLPMFFFTLAFFCLVLFETDLGGAMLLLICALSIMWVGGARLLPIAASFAAVVGGVIVAITPFVPYMRERIAMWFGHVPNAQLSDTVGAFASGGLLGAGLTQGGARNAGVLYLESDYAFSLIGEELGLFGMLLVLGLYCAFLWYALRLVLSLTERYAALAAFGLLVSVGLQAMLHVQVVAGLAPPKGMTLPFVSDGGTSLIVSSLAVGLAIGAARRANPDIAPCSP
ncbi:MAG: FtsW/RodA/SpoVE family cell cycle protein [Planctomycetota bacterium]|nr:FtsW/RodA/SpoVE family cell cycle protein [Planctomycetota bacterium]